MRDDLIKRSDAIKDLCDISNNSDMPNDWHRGMSVAISALYRVPPVPPADRPQEWIPCSERLPNEGEMVLVCMRIESHKAEWEEQRSIEFGRISSDRYDFNGTGWEWLNESGADYWQADCNNSILAWMPLPKPWKGADDE